MREFYSVEDDYSTCVEDLEPMVTTVNHERESGRIVVEGQRACVADCARTCAREAHGRCAATLPVIADALRDVRAAEARLVAHQHACIEAHDAITGAVAARAHEWPRVGA